jgi:hypothetical protein
MSVKPFVASDKPFVAEACPPMKFHRFSKWTLTKSLSSFAVQSSNYSPSKEKSHCCCPDVDVGFDIKVDVGVGVRIGDVGFVVVNVVEGVGVDVGVGVGVDVSVGVCVRGDDWKS